MEEEGGPMEGVTRPREAPADPSRNAAVFPPGAGLFAFSPR